MVKFKCKDCSWECIVSEEDYEYGRIDVFEHMQLTDHNVKVEK